MKPIAIFRHSPTEGPGYFATFLERHSIPWQLVRIDAGDALPEDVQAFSGLCLMGGPMSVNDPLPWIAPLCQLIRRAVAVDLPVIGHCLGGQLMSHALGGRVTANAVKEIGWGTVQADDNAEAARWLGEAVRPADEAIVFQWHGETFSLPPGAVRILTNAHCSNQVFVLGPHLGMQCHVEMSEAMIAAWCKDWDKETRHLPSLPPSIQTPEKMMTETASNLPRMRELAERLYTVWIRGLPRT